MTANDLNMWPEGIEASKFPTYAPRNMRALGLWQSEDWAIKTYAIQVDPKKTGSDFIAPELLDTAKAHVLNLLPLTREEGAFYKTGFAVLHEGAQANWLMFQWWTHDDVWCQILSYSDSKAPLLFKHSTRPVRACVYETAIIWHEQKSWIAHVLNGNADRRAYLGDMMTDPTV